MIRIKNFFYGLINKFLFYRYFKIESKKYLRFNKTIKNKKNNIIIPIFYWGGTNVSWLQLEFALHFIKNGNKIFFIFNNQIEFKFSYFLHFFLIKRIIQKFVKHLNVEILEFDKLKPFSTTDKYDQIAKDKEYFLSQWTQKKSIQYKNFFFKSKTIENNIFICQNIENIIFALEEYMAILFYGEKFVKEIM